MTLIEGAHPGYINVHSTVPPRMFCDYLDRQDEVCSVRFVANIISTHESRCPDGREITQAVIGWQGSGKDDAFCGSVIDDMSWNTNHRIPIKATIDSLKDKDQIRTVQVSLEITSSFGTQTFDLERVQVNVCVITAHWLFQH